MPKRKNEEKIKFYQRKLRKMEQEQRKYNRIIYSSSEDTDHNSDNENLPNSDLETRDADPIPSDKKEEAKNDSDQEPIPVPELDPEILTALGEVTEETPKFGPKIHEKLSLLWLPILRKGINKEVKDKLAKEYPVPENCTLLQAPTLNPEISAAVPEGTRTRDKRVEAVQQQLGQGFSALNKGLELLLDDGKDRLQAIKYLSDSCRILCDLHFIETEARKKFDTPGLDKSFLNIMQDIDRDETLFGNKLSEKIKATKVIEKHGLQIKKPAPNPKPPSSSYQPSTSRSRPQGNWRGPSRFLSNRGGEGRTKEHCPERGSSSDSELGSAEATAAEQAACPNSSTIEIHAGRIQYFYDCWLQITNNTQVLNWISKGYKIPFCKKVRQVFIPRNSVSISEQPDMLQCIEKILDLGAITPCHRLRNDFISSVFLAPKANGTKRFILNLKNLNKFILNSHFKMEDHRTAARLVPQSGFMANIDLKEAYLLVPIAKEDHRYLRFEYNQRFFEFTAMPYGLSIAPWVFTKLMREVINHLRQDGYRSVIYLDDILWIGDTYDECINNVKKTLALLRCLGFVINYEKSNLEPRQVCRFLGFVFNTIDMTLNLPEEKRQGIMKFIKKFSKLPRCSIRELSQLIGVLTAACPAVRYGWIYTKTLERQKYLALQNYNDNFEAKINLSNVILPDLNWWERNIMSTYNLIRQDKQFVLEIYTDASRTGWGAACNGKRANGGWKDEELSFHINYLELLAVFLGLKIFAKKHHDCSILLRVDNTTALCYINRMGGIRFSHLNDLTKTIWQWCEKRNIFIYASYINTLDNLEADEESRKINVDTEWELSNWAFQTIVQALGKPQIDLFASRINAKCNQYISWKPDSDALTVDAFTVSWNCSFFYAFPPFALILKCLRKIIEDKATGILVFPYWPSQAWFPLLKRMLITDIIFFEPNRELLRSRFRSCHRLHTSLILGAATLSGQHSQG